MYEERERKRDRGAKEKRGDELKKEEEEGR
jgi:hypothetical protein